ncbi:MAG: LCP family protein [Propionibacteriaceae bacterium]|nr:LCP family protein [Propionibacteriaceae bacterium]
MSTTRRSLIGASFLGVAAALGACTAQPAPSQTPVAPTPTPQPTTTPTPTPTPTPVPIDPLPAGVVNALVFGTDSRDPKSLTGNADAILVAQISADRSRLTLVSIARDSHVPFAGGGQGKINAAFSGGGTERLRETVSMLLGGLPIHMVAQNNFNNFIAITRWLKGIRVNNKNATRTRVISTGRVVEFPQGELFLENTDALIYSRERKTMPLGDLDRAERHRALIVGMLRGLKAVAIERPDEFAVLAGNVISNTKVTDFDAARVADLADPLVKINLDQVSSLLVPIERFGTIGGASVCVVNEAKNAQLAAALNAGDVSGYIAEHGTGYELG